MPTATGAATLSLPGPRVEPAVRVHDQQQAADPSRRALSGTTPAGPAARDHWLETTGAAVMLSRDLSLYRPRFVTVRLGPGR